MCKKINFAVQITIIFIILCFLFNSIYLKNYENILTDLVIIALVFLPKVLNKIFKLNIPYSLEIFYTLLLFFGKYLGADYFYYSVVPLYDKIIHIFYAVFAALISMFLLVKTKTYNKKNMVFNIIFIIAFTLGTAVIWEFLEFSSDKILHENNQRLETGIFDTMIDLILTFVTSLIFVADYFIEIKFHKKGMLSSFIANIKKRGV